MKKTILIFSLALLLFACTNQSSTQNAKQSNSNTKTSTQDQAEQLSVPTTIPQAQAPDYKTVLTRLQNLSSQKTSLSEQSLDWSTQESTITLEGEGFSIYEATDEDTLDGLFSSAQSYLESQGFSIDPFNTSNSSPSFQNLKVSKDQIACSIVLSKDDVSTITIICAPLPQHFSNGENGALSEKEAIQIAESSTQCKQAGTLTQQRFYNENSQTWWIDIDGDKPGCNPACVIYEDEHTEVNWRCTGLAPQN
ncbi:hypothetical protein GYA49_05055 [Candidatus Beckwithbacteria bacterium]|nr:hypothetical protein [Candidatus Beckwithbacteria bacterium]